jgi:uncharacterized membrane protein
MMLDPLILESFIVVLSLGLSLALRPWRLLASGTLINPLLACLVLGAIVWMSPFLLHAPLPLHWSGAPLITLMLGWPLAVPVLTGMGLSVWLGTDASASLSLAVLVWQGLVPSLLTVLVGAALRRWVGHHPMVYVLGRCFFGTVASIFLANALGLWSGHAFPSTSSDLSMVAHWLTAWGDAIITGMLGAIFVAYRPQWLATWSDDLYLKA